MDVRPHDQISAEKSTHCSKKKHKRSMLHTLILCVDFPKQRNIPLYVQRQRLYTFKVIFNIADQLGFFHIWVMSQHRDRNASSRPMLKEVNSLYLEENSTFRDFVWCCSGLSGLVSPTLSMVVIPSNKTVSTTHA